MARVADYAIIADAWHVEGFDATTINFEVPSNIDNGSRCVLGFMMKEDNLDDLTLRLKINGTEVWNWSVSGSSDYPARFFQEVVAAGVVHAGTNTFSFHTSSDDFRFTELSDVVLWFQANT
jgi:hypothetical protein